MFISCLNSAPAGDVVVEPIHLFGENIVFANGDIIRHFGDAVSHFRCVDVLRRSANDDGTVAEILHFKGALTEHIQMTDRRVVFLLAERDGNGLQKELRRCSGFLCLKTFINDPLMSGMLVDQ